MLSKLKNRNINFNGLVLALVMMSLAILSIRGLNMGIEFTGGHTFEISSQSELITDALPAELKGRAIVSNSSNGTSLRIKELSSEQVLQIKEIFGDSLLSSESIGATMGSEMIERSIFSLSLALFCIFAYLSFRFNVCMSMSAVIALGQDIIVSLAFVSLLQIEVNTLLVGAIMTIIGYSINDSVVTLDKMRELTRDEDAVPDDLFYSTVPRIIKRTLVTSVSTLLVLLSLIVFGGDALFDFASTLAVGVTSGTISSLVVVIGITQFCSKKSSKVLIFNKKPSLEGDL